MRQIVGFADDLHANGPWNLVEFRPRPRQAPSVGLLLFAGVAVFALVKLLSASSRPTRSKVAKIGLAVLLLAVGATVMSLRRSARRYRW